MENCTYITYLGENILFINHVGLRGEDLLKNIQYANTMIFKAPHHELLVLADFTDTYADDEIIAYLSGEESKQAAKKIRKMAVVGVTGIKKIFLNTYNLVTRSGTRAFDDLESAKQYLAS